MVRGLAVSNVAWAADDTADALALARELGVAGVEVAPYNLWGRWDLSDVAVREFRARLDEYGLVCPALQGILFNVPDVALFGDRVQRDALTAHLRAVARIAGLLGAGACVFGSPKQRDPGDLPPERARDLARRFFAEVGPMFTDRGTALAIEPNARAYACRFLTTTADAAAFVAEVGTPGIALQIDTGTLFLEDEDPAVLQRAASLAAHAHVSEPQLGPVGAGGVDHGPVARAFRASPFDGYLSIEMRPADPWADGIRAAVRTVNELYLS
ncbi:MAG: sugar phosphate isomerase/epimerase [Gemmatimonadetes bacterium]|nr:sugar phosphate isomerase/epimerase [Gemmatimonadota bacterium]